MKSPPKLRVNGSERGFTLIELSIVLVIIGLIVGGVLVGQSLIAAATVRAQITQIEKYNTAAATFQGKYGYLPGDITATAAAQFGFTTRAGTAGRGDGNGEIDGWNYQAVSWNAEGETLLFWEDLSSAKLIDGTFNTYVDGTVPTCTLGLACANYFPTAKIGNGNMIYVYSGSYTSSCSSTLVRCGPNYFGLSVQAIGTQANYGSGYNGTSNPGLTVAQAYAIDTKMDDGLPTSGRTIAQYVGTAGGVQSWSTNSTTDSASTCYNSAKNAYSVTVSSGANVNCGLSFQFQAGD